MWGVSAQPPDFTSTDACETFNFNTDKPVEATLAAMRGEARRLIAFASPQPIVALDGYGVATIL